MSYGNGEKRTIVFLEAALAEERKQNDHTMVTAGKIAAEMQMEVARLMAENEQLRAIIIPRYKFLMKLFEDGCYMNEQEKSDLADMAPLLVDAALKGEPK